MDKWINIYGVIWTKIDDCTVHNFIKGYGIWDDGRGFIKVES